MIFSRTKISLALLKEKAAVRCAGVATEKDMYIMYLKSIPIFLMIIIAVFLHFAPEKGLSQQLHNRKGIFRQI